MQCRMVMRLIGDALAEPGTGETAEFVDPHIEFCCWQQAPFDCERAGFQIGDWEVLFYHPTWSRRHLGRRLCCA